MSDSNKTLEMWNILYDIFIDEERYEDILIKFNNYIIKEDLENILDNNLKQGSVLKFLFDVEKNIVTNNIRLNRYTYTKFNYFWIYIFLAKNTRAIIQKKGSTKVLDTLDEIAEYLLSKIPLTYNNSGSGRAEKPESIGNRKFRTIIYNEVSQCNIGYLSAGFAEKALQQYPKESCHYELLGLYNKALGLAHHENRKSREKALNYYDSIIIYFKSAGGTDYKYNFNKELWKKYVYIPALLQKADLLIKLQRGQESVALLDEIINYPNTLFKMNNFRLDAQYILINALILKGYANIEASKYDNILPVFNAIQEEIIRDRKILKNKHELLKAKLYIQQTLDRIIVGKEAYEKITESLRICEDIYVTSRDNGEEGEQVLAALYWLESLSAKINEIKEIKVNKDEIIFLNKIICLITDTLNQKGKMSYKSWIPVKDKIIKIAIEILEKINTGSEIIGSKKEISLFEQLKKNEIRLYEVLLKGNGFKPSNYNKVKFCRRSLLLGNKKFIKKYKEFDFPSKDEIDTVQNFVSDSINRDFYIRQLRFNTESFDENLIYKSYWPQYRNNFAFTVLRKWQSYTPSLGSYSATSRGGGYFLYRVGIKGFIEEGIVIDPGYDFIENFLEHKFSVLDINAIAFTHSHIDHSVDFRGLITLVREMNNRASKQKHDWKPRKIRIIATPSCFDLFYSTLNDCRDFIEDVVITDPYMNKMSESIELENHFSISTVSAYHKEIHDDANCTGLIIRNKNDNKLLIGFTGDTVWTRTLSNHLKNCSVVCINMGSLLDVRKGQCFEKNYKDENEIKKLIFEQNHLYLPGTITILDELLKFDFKGIAVVGELGEELKTGLRLDLYHKFNEFVSQKGSGSIEKFFKVSMEDIGLTITWDKDYKPQMRCFRCKNSIPHESVRLRVEKDIRGSEQLNYYCKECIKIIEDLEIGVEENWIKPYLPPQ